MIHRCVIVHHKQCTLESRVFLCKGLGLFHVSSCLRFPSILINFLSFLRIPLLKPLLYLERMRMASCELLFEIPDVGWVDSLQFYYSQLS
uniref:Uncharacterized protein n=1 Tax=Populus trichocarpa TaxID=3694 RepID=A0A2K1ZID1_POPTR